MKRSVFDERQFEQRKQDHISLALQPVNQASECNVFDQYHLIHEALPDYNFEEVNLQTVRFGLPVPKPFLVSSMTAGHQDAGRINEHLMAACAVSGWAMGVGSQRRELSDKEAALAWKPLKSAFPKVSLFSNIGIAQALEVPMAAILDLIHVLEAQALIVHCNALQEVIQCEGTPQFKGCWQRLEDLVKQLPCPLIVKETGCGFSQRTLQRLDNVGVAAVDVAGLGGTHWGRIEGQRATHDKKRANAAQVFKNWGIDTVRAVQMAVGLKPCFEVWGSGGVRHGLDAAKLFAMGVTMVGFAKPMLQPALTSVQTVIDCMEAIEYELQIALFCTGSKTILDLKGKLCP